jgi:hypothetical protein
LPSIYSSINIVSAALHLPSSYLYLSLETMETINLPSETLHDLPSLQLMSSFCSSSSFFFRHSLPSAFRYHPPAVCYLFVPVFDSLLDCFIFVVQLSCSFCSCSPSLLLILFLWRIFILLLPAYIFVLFPYKSFTIFALPSLWSLYLIFLPLQKYRKLQIYNKNISVILLSSYKNFHTPPPCPPHILLFMNWLTLIVKARMSYTMKCDAMYGCRMRMLT